MSFFWECALRVSAILAIAFGISFALRRQSAALRHVVWTAAFSIGLLTPALFFWGPKTVPMGTADDYVVVSTVAEQIPEPASMPRRSPSIPYESAALALWAAGVLVLAIRAVRASLQARWLRRTAEPLDASAIAAYAQLPLNVFHGIELAQNESAAVAMTMGVRNPLVLLPSQHTTWDGSRLRLVLLHEIAHLRRRDCLIQWLPQAVCILHWFNPLAWLARAQMLCESERACDDAVLRGGATGADFARDLFEIAQSSGWKGADPMPTILTKLERRITRLLDPSTNRSPLTRAAAILSAGAVIALLAPIVGLRAQNAAADPLAQAGTLSGIVSDPSGAVVANASVRLSGPSGVLTVNTNSTGAWSASLPPGTYAIEVSVPGFAAARLNSVNLPAGASMRIDHHLEIGQIAESITVTAPGTPRAAQAAVAGARKPIRVGGMLQAAKLISKTPPVYPDSLRQQGVEGTVVIQAVIGKSGNVLEAHVAGGGAPITAGGRGGAAVLSPQPEFAEAALNAVRTWQYEPTLLNGEPVEVLTTIAVNFQLR